VHRFVASCAVLCHDCDVIFCALFGNWTVFACQLSMLEIFSLTFARCRLLLISGAYSLQVKWDLCAVLDDCVTCNVADN